MRRLALVLIAFAIAAPASSARRRTVHHPAPACSFSLVPSWGSSPVSAAGVTRALVLVYGQTQECSQWAAYSSADWITVEAAPMAAQPGAFVTVAPNTLTTARTATLIIAGVRLTVTQEGGSQVSPPVAANILVNGSFDRNVSGWGWPRADYPNGPGVPQWSQFDANGSPASGSMLLRDVDYIYTQAFQTLQCVPIDSGRTYEFGVKLRTASADGEPQIAFLTYTSANCSGNYKIRFVPSVGVVQPGGWQQLDYRQRVELGERSAVLVLGAAANTVPPFEVWFDDAYLREVK